ncbi:MAG: hypothetical protein WHV44_00660 [Anaerolineales bacterium]
MRGGKQSKQEIIEALEGSLSGVLKPVHPSETFVRHVRNRISIAPPDIVVERLHDTRMLLVALGGILSFLLVIITGTRALYYLLGRSK